MKKIEVPNFIGQEVPCRTGNQIYKVKVLGYGYKKSEYTGALIQRPGAKGVLVEVEYPVRTEREVVMLGRLIAQPWAEWRAKEDVARAKADAARKRDREIREQRLAAREALTESLDAALKRQSRPALARTAGWTMALNLSDQAIADLTEILNAQVTVSENL
jgi:hypothetical protein